MPDTAKKRLALQLLVQLPDDRNEARQVLMLALEAVELFYAPARPAPRPSSPNLVAISTVKPATEPR